MLNMEFLILLMILMVKWNDVQETIVGYDENINKLGVVVQGQLYLNGESKPTIIENLTTNGMPVISIPSSDGTSLYAFANKFH